MRLEDLILRTRQYVRYWRRELNIRALVVLALVFNRRSLTDIWSALSEDLKKKEVRSFGASSMLFLLPREVRLNLNRDDAEVLMRCWEHLGFVHRPNPDYRWLYVMTEKGQS